MTSYGRPIMERKPRRHQLPPRTPGGPNELVEALDLVVVGANGSGKSRFGLAIEGNSEQPRLTYRIAAQRVLEVPDYVVPTDLQAAMRGLWYGYDQPDAGPQHRHGSRYGSRPATITLNDYQRLIQALLSDEYDRTTEYMNAKRAGDDVPVPDTLIERLRRIWHFVLPHRTLRQVAGKFQVFAAGQQPYHSKEMSDGERVVLYIIGQALCAPPGGTLVVDEPELHLHRAIQAKLWDAIEAERGDCSFVYLTHDVDFAASRHSATKIALFGFDGEHWRWDIVPGDSGLPDALLLEVLGNRRRTLFVEGVRGSLDDSIYRLVYPEYDVRPVGSWLAVVAATKAFNDASLIAIHHLEAAGIVDLDYRTEQEIAGLKAAGIHCLSVAQIENVLLQERFMDAFAQRLLAPPTAVADAKELIIGEFRAYAHTASIRTAEQIVDRQLGAVASGVGTPAELENRINQVLAKVDAKKTYDTALARIIDACNRQDYAAVLRLFKRKGLSSQISVYFGLSTKSYTDKAIELAKQDSDARTKLSDAMPSL